MSRISAILRLITAKEYFVLTGKTINASRIDNDNHSLIEAFCKAAERCDKRYKKKQADAMIKEGNK